MKPAFDFEFSRERAVPFRGDATLPEWFAVRPPADADVEEGQRPALGLAIAVVSSLVFWAGVAIVVFGAI